MWPAVAPVGCDCVVECHGQGVRHLKAVVAKPPETVATLRARAGRRRRRVQEQVLTSIVVKVGHDDLERIGHLDIVCAGISRKL